METPAPTPTSSPLSGWDGFVQFYNSHTDVQLLLAVLFWGLLVVAVSVTVAILKRREKRKQAEALAQKKLKAPSCDSRKRGDPGPCEIPCDVGINHVNLQSDLRIAEFKMNQLCKDIDFLNQAIKERDEKLKVFEGEGDVDAFWKKKKDLYDYLRKQARQLVHAYTIEMERLISEQIRLKGVPDNYQLTFHEVRTWGFVFKTIGGILIGQFFDDIETNGFEEIGNVLDAEGNQTTDRAQVDQYIQDKALFFISLIEERVRMELKETEFYRTSEGQFKPTPRILTFSDIQVVMQKVQADTIRQISETYLEAIRISKEIHGYAF